MIVPNSGKAQHHKTVLQTTANKAIRQGFADGPDGQIHYWTAGTGPALVMIHQSSASVEEYASLVPYLADGYQVIAMDLPGHGASDDPDKELGVPEYTQSIMAVVNHLNIKKFHVLGHHGGALMAMNLGYQYPQQVQKIILSGTSNLKPPAAVKEFSESLDLKKKSQVDKEGKSIIDAWGRYLKYLPDTQPEKILIPFVNNIITRIRPYDAHYKVLEWDRRPAAYSLKGPILLMQGAQDPFVSEQEKLLEVYPQAERQVIEEGGVFMFYNKAKECATVIRSFLDKPYTAKEREREVLFKRSTLLVSNLEQSLKVYRDILGFSVFKIEASSSDSYSYPVFKIPKEATIKFATLNSPTQVRTMALTEVTGVELPKPQPPLMSAAVINVDDLDKVMAQIKALGLEMTDPKIDEGNDFTFKEQAFVDFDGHLIVLYQIVKD